MSILNVNTIQPIGSGTTVTVAATELKTSNFITVGTGASVTSPSANVLTLGTNDTERFRITSAGLIGIGTVSPSGPIHAHVASGTQRSYLEASASHSFLRLKSGSTSYNSGVEFFSGASNIANVNALGAGGLQFEVNESERLRITATGDLDFKTTDGVGINFLESGYINIDSDNNDSSRNFSFYDAKGTGSEKLLMRIVDDGKIGINETSPDVLLHLTETNANPYNTVITHLKLENGGGNGGSGSRIELKTGAASCWIQSFIEGGNSGSGGALVFGTPSSGTLGTERMRIMSDGTLKIGTGTGNPILMLSASTSGTSVIQMGDTADNNIGQIHYVNSDDSMKFFTNNAERLRIKNNGTVHVGDAFEGGGYFNVYATNVENGIDLIGNISGSNQNSSSPKLRFQGYAQSNGPWIQGINVDGYGYKDLVFGVNRTATNYTTLPTETARFTQDGRFMVNTISSRIVEDWAGNGPQGRIQIEQTNSNALMSIISAGTADANRAGTLVLGRHRNSTIGGTPTIVQSGDTTGAIVFAAGDGSDMRSKSAIIRSRVGTTPGSSKIPGDLIFATTNTDDGEQPEERLAIDHRASFIRRYPRLTTSGTYDTGSTRGYNSSATGTVRIPGSAGDTFYFSVTMPSYYASGSIPQTVKASIQYATYHASGYGAGEYFIHQKHGANGGRRLDVVHFRKLSEVYAGGWYYGMNTNFTTRLYETTNDEANASIVFRVQVRTGNGITYDGDARLHIKIETLGGFANHPEPRITWHGTSSPSGLGSEVSATTLSWP